MEELSFMDKLKRKFEEGKHVCVGLDTDPEKISKRVEKLLRRRFNLPLCGAIGPLVFRFNQMIVEATKDIAACYKMNRAFYEGHQRLWALERTVEYLRENAPDVPWIFDAKYGDIGNTNEEYAKHAFGWLGAGAVTVHNYLGREAIQPFLDYENRGIFVLARTSNKGAREFQDIRMDVIRAGALSEVHMYELVAERVSGFNEHDGPVPERGWNTNRNCGLVVGATYPSELARVRGVVGDMPILIPGVGAQGGDLEGSVEAAIYIDPNTGEKSLPAIFNSSRGIIYARKTSKFAEAAREKTKELNDSIRRSLENVR